MKKEIDMLKNELSEKQKKIDLSIPKTNAALYVLSARHENVRMLSVIMVLGVLCSIFPFVSNYAAAVLGFCVVIVSYVQLLKNRRESERLKNTYGV